MAENIGPERKKSRIFAGKRISEQQQPSGSPLLGIWGWKKKGYKKYRFCK
jgi:hypothetical protein